jgi:hypothetical protein
MSEIMPCPQCGGQMVRARLLTTSLRRSVTCQSCGTQFRLKVWVLATLGGLAGVLAPAAAIAALLYWSLVPFVGLFIAMGLAYTLVYAWLPRLVAGSCPPTTKRAQP